MVAQYSLPDKVKDDKNGYGTPKKPLRTAERLMRRKNIFRFDFLWINSPYCLFCIQ